jgi:3-oxoacid CoA-transferase subunit B
MTAGLNKEQIAFRVAQELQDGMYVNLGIGLPGLVSQYIPKGLEVMLHAENGVLGYGSIKEGQQVDTDLINASLRPIGLRPGASFFNHADSFTMVRGGRLDLTVLGGYQVSEKGDLANWKTIEEKVGAVGGAMDLVCGVKKVIVAMQHTFRSGEPRIVKKCTYPLTGKEVVDMIVTNLAVIDVTPEGLLLREVAPGVSATGIQAMTEPTLIVSPDLKEMELGI